MPLHVSSTCAHHLEVKILLYSRWYHHTYKWPSGAQVEYWSRIKRWENCVFSFKHRGVDKSLARPGRNKLVFLSEWREFPSAPCLAGKKKFLTARVSMLLKSRASLTCFRACFLPGRAKDLSAPRCILVESNCTKGCICISTVFFSNFTPFVSSSKNDMILLSLPQTNYRISKSKKINLSGSYKPKVV